MANSRGVAVLLGLLAATAGWYVWRWWRLERPRHPHQGPRAADLLLGFGSNFLDTLGIGSFAPATAVFKLRRRMPDDQIPGTLNVGQALPTLTEALIFIALVSVDLVTLSAMIAAAVVGAWLGAGLVARAPRRAIQLAMAVALLAAAALLLARNLGWLPAASGTADGLRGTWLAVAVGINGLLGALMMVGVGLYAPCLILVTLLGMSPLAAFPIMMGSCALLMPVGGVRFISAARYCRTAALGLTLGGIPGVFTAAYLVRSLAIDWLRWLVLGVVLYAALLMLSGARARTPAEVR